MNLQVYTILFYSSSYLLFLALLWVSNEKKGIRLFDKDGLVLNPGVLIVLHVGGIILFGVLPFLTGYASFVVLYNSAALGGLPVWLTLLLVICISIFSSQIAKRKSTEVIRNGAFNTSLSTEFFFAYFFVRIIFICTYEIWFRGFLLHDCIINFGVPLAILMNVSLYTLLHVVNGKEETPACIPFGLLLCSICIWQGTAWPAVVIHLALTISYEISFLRKIIYKQAVI